MKCPKCGKRIAGKVNFCPYCGYKDENGAMGGSKVGGLKEKISNLPPEKKKKLKLATIISSVSLVVVIAVIIIAVVFSSIFRIGKVKKVELDMTMSQVEKLLGKPYDEDDAFVGGRSINYWVYYESKATKILKQIDKIEDSDIEDFDELEKAIEKEDKLYEKLEKEKFKSIVIGFDKVTDKVVSIAFNTKTKYNEADPYDCWGDKTIKSFELNKTILTINEDLQNGGLWYTATYSDGSYRKELIVELQGLAISTAGTQTVEFDNGWSRKRLNFEVKDANVVAESVNTSWGRVRGTGYYANGQEVTLTASPSNNYSFDGWYQGDALVSTDNPYTFRNTKPNEAQTFTARFSVLDWSRVAGYEAFNVEQSGSEIVIKSIKDATLTNIIIPEGATKIGENAFENNTAITSISIPNTITTIGRNAFGGCTGIESMTIPGSVSLIGSDAFYRCYNLESINYAGSLADWCELTGIGNLPINNAEIRVNGALLKGDLVIPEGATKISQRAFSYCGELTSITIPSSVKIIESDAFYGCNGLTAIYYTGDVAGWCDISGLRDVMQTQITLHIGGERLSGELVIPDDVVKIADHAFYGCTELTSITIPDSVTSIGGHAFSGCTGLTSATIGNGLTSISSSMFYNCRSLASITIPNSVTSISDEAFLGCTGLTSVTIGDSVTSISTSAFYRCSGLASITVDSNNANFSSQDGILYNKAKTEIVYVPSEIQGEIAIPNGITTIKDSEFAYCSGLTSVILPDSVKTIGEEAFDQCTNLTSATLPSGLTTIADEMFNGCTKLVSVNIQDSVTSIGNYAFSGCGLQTITLPSSLKTIGRSAFADCEFTSIVIPDSVTSIGEYAFGSCDKLTSVTVGSGVRSIGDRAFYYCGLLIEVYNKSSLNITAGSTAYGYVGSYAQNVYTVAGGNKLSTDENGYIVYTDGEDRILVGYEGNERDLILPNDITQIRQQAFAGRNLSSVVIPDSVTSIGRQAFESCTGLTSITIPNSVTSIGYNAFNGCYHLVEVYNKSALGITAGDDGYGYVGYYAKNVYTEADGSKLSVDQNGYVVYTDAEDRILICHTGDANDLTLPDGITEIGDYAFRGRRNLKSVTIPNGVTRIGWEAFYNCTDLTSVTIPNSLTSIGYRAFYGAGLTSITIPNSVTSIGEDAFYGCTGLTSATIGNGLTRISSCMFYNCRSLASITIGDSVTSIESNAFNGCTGLTSITIPNSVTSIGWYAFISCTGLTSITIPASVTYIDYAFKDCDNLESINYTGGIAGWCNLSGISNLKASGATLYINGSTLTGHLSIPSGVTRIPSNAFSGCTGLTSVTIPNSVTSIESNAFNGCTGLTSVTIPNSVTSISDSAFSGCTGLTSVTIPASVTSMSNSVFSGCTGLTSITVAEDNPNYSSQGGILYNKDKTSLIFVPAAIQGEVVIPDSVTAVSYNAFNRCTGVTSVTIPASVTSMSNSVFSGCTGLTSITVAEDNPNYSSQGGILYNKDKTSLIFVPVAIQGEVVIPDSVTVMSSDAFNSRAGITSIVLPNNLTSIGWWFNGCTGLTTITIPVSVTYIESWVFEDCSLTSIIYEGTISQWNAISKSNGWDYGTGNYTVYCTDGNIEKAPASSGNQGAGGEGGQGGGGQGEMPG